MPNDESPKTKELKTKSRKTKADYRAEIEPAQLPAHSPAYQIVEQALASGPAGVRDAQRRALKYAKRYIDDQTERWRVSCETDYLKNILSEYFEVDPARCARARDALRWRPRFLAHYVILNNIALAARASRVSKPCVLRHAQRDPQFAQLMREAKEEAVDLLEGVHWRRALEGDLEPQFYMGVPIAYVRKYDSKLAIEMLRAHRPQTFKTPGTNVNIATRGDVFVLTEEQRHELQDMQRRYLLTAPLPRDAVDNGVPHNGNLPVQQQGDTTNSQALPPNTSAPPPGLAQ